MKRKSPRLDMEVLIRDHRAGRLKEPPARVMDRAIALRERLVPRTRALGAWIAALLFDSALTPAPAGVRRASTSGERRLLYGLSVGEKEAAQLDVRIRHDGGATLEVLGQLLPPPGEAEIELRAGRARRKLVPGPNGEFRAVGLSAGVAKVGIVIRVGGRVVVAIDELPVPDAGWRRP